MIKMFLDMIMDLLADWLKHPITIAAGILLLSFLLFHIGAG
tara:strand:+ start:576 stop:698 length:123 start_codon:yes stop_codon:yes gene_type:complete